MKQQVREGATVVSTSTRNFSNRLGKNTNVYLASTELAAIVCRANNRARTVPRWAKPAWRLADRLLRAF